MDTRPAQFVVSVLQLLVSGVALVAVFHQIRNVVRGLKAQTLSNLYSEYLKVCQMVVQNPEIRPYLFDGKALDSDMQSDRRCKVLAACEWLTGILELAVTQRPNLPEHSVEGCWDAFIKAIYSSGGPDSAMQAYFRANREIYTKDFKDTVDRVIGSASKPPIPELGKQAKA
jgi:hypothetical protein